MIKIYTAPSCKSCRKAKSFFVEQEIPFKEKNILVTELEYDEIKDILTKSENGVEDIISTRSKVFKEKGMDIDNMKISELIRFIRDNPSVLKRPIMVDDNKIQVGYNEEEIEVFIPHEKRLLQWGCKKESCPTFSTCTENKTAS